MKVILNENTILFAHSISKQMELDSKKEEISKTITLSIDDYKLIIVCKSVQDKHLLWTGFRHNTNNSIDLTQECYKNLIEGIQL